MPICPWCGIESKNDLVCDWCKRPLALRPSRRTDARSGVDLLKQEDDEGGGLVTRILSVVGVVALVAIIAVSIVLLRKQDEVTADNSASSGSDPKTSFRPVRGPATDAQPISSPPALLGPAIIATSAPAVGDGAMGAANNGSIRVVASTGSPMANAALKSFHIDLNNSDVDNEHLRLTGSEPLHLRNGVLRIQGRARNAVGILDIVNSSEDNVVDFQLEATIKGRTASMRTFEGTADKARSYGQTTIHPGEKLSVPVMVSGPFSGARGSILQATIRIRAFMDYGPGAPVVVTIYTP
jgi:hypothetical protein